MEAAFKLLQNHGEELLETRHFGVETYILISQLIK
jgi:hypothetical protein